MNAFRFCLPLLVPRKRAGVRALLSTLDLEHSMSDVAPSPLSCSLSPPPKNPPASHPHASTHSAPAPPSHPSQTPLDKSATSDPAQFSASPRPPAPPPISHAPLKNFPRMAQRISHLWPQLLPPPSPNF